VPYLPVAFEMMFQHLFDYLRQIIEIMMPAS